MNTGPVSVRYATALFELAREKNLAKEIDGDVARIGAEFAESSVAAYFADARVPMADKRARLDTLGKTLHPLTYNFLRLLADKQRLGVLPELALAYRRNVLREAGAIEGVVEAPRALSDADIAELASSLGSRLSKKVVLTQRLEPSLLAGARVVVDNRMIDASASGRLEALRSKLLVARLNSH